MKKILSTLIVFVICIIVLCGCSEKNEVKLGKYTTEGDVIEQAWVNLKENNEFEFVRNLATSYLPRGNYKVEGDKLTLHVSDEEEYIFRIEDDKLIFEEGKAAENFVKAGDEFFYTEEQK